MQHKLMKNVNFNRELTEQLNLKLYDVPCLNFHYSYRNTSNFPSHRLIVL